MTTLLFLDDCHVGDPLFLADLGRRLSKLGRDGRTVIVHRVGEAVDRELENSNPRDRILTTEKTIRETNHGIARRLTQEGVPAVSIQGSDRGLFRTGDPSSPASAPLRRASPRQAHRLSTNATWLLAMIGTGSIPVVSPLALGPAGAEAVDPVECAREIAHLAASAGDVHAALFCSTRKGGLFQDGVRLGSITVSDLANQAEIIDVEAAVTLVKAVDRLVATNSVGVTGELSVKGTIITT
ncbi:MAG: hypothetical protein ACC655_02530 [Rhodothermia bacterium]